MSTCIFNYYRTRKQKHQTSFLPTHIHYVMCVQYMIVVHKCPRSRLPNLFIAAIWLPAVTMPVRDKTAADADMRWWWWDQGTAYILT